ncbi:MAG TPA: LapA family protein [Gammaproteobacteria bacterium]|nr:LapA family protein [Gammaproteobacteria bacterium]
MKVMRIISYVLILLIILLGITFAVRNDTPVTLDYYLGNTKIALSLLMVYCLGIGIILGFLTTIYPWFKLKNRNRSLKNHIKQLEKNQAVVAETSSLEPTDKT